MWLRVVFRKILEWIRRFYRKAYVRRKISRIEYIDGQENKDLKVRLVEFLVVLRGAYLWYADSCTRECKRYYRITDRIEKLRFFGRGSLLEEYKDLLENSKRLIIEYRDKGLRNYRRFKTLESVATDLERNVFVFMEGEWVDRPTYNKINAAVALIKKIVKKLLAQ